VADAYCPSATLVPPQRSARGAENARAMDPGRPPRYRHNRLRRLPRRERETDPSTWQEAHDDVLRQRSGFVWIGLHEPSEHQFAA
jgi:hypothetical protein